MSLDTGIWNLGAEIYSGGFARVHEAVAPNGDPAVLKLIPKDPGARRELLLEEIAGVPNVMPILAKGERGDDWVLAMPRADRSLRDHIGSRGALDPTEAVPILRDIAKALVGLGGRVIHRDLKPENVLWWRGAWHLADFGIARYAEHTTAPDTRKFAMTVEYAAPEQWRLERATGATDVYSLGVMAYELLSGTRPFPGPAWEDFREQHLGWHAPALEHVPASLASVVATCLIKEPEARPSPARVLARLDVSKPAPSGAAARLQQIDLEATQRTVAELAAAEAERTASERRQRLYAVAMATLKPIHDSLHEQLLENVPMAAPTGRRNWPFELNGARIEWIPVRDGSGTDWEHYPPAFDLIAHAGIQVQIPPTRSDYVGRSHSLWYCDARREGEFRWYETAFMVMPLVSWRTRMNPVSLDPGPDAGEALSNVMGVWQMAWPFTPIDQGESAEFTERWLGWFADGVQGQLQHPRQMPERNPRDSYRR